MDDPTSLITKLYNVLTPEEILGKAKEGSWQTFFHHSVSVGLVAFRIGKIIRDSSPFVSKSAIRAIKEELSIDYEYVLFLTGLAHDYVKLVPREGKTSAERIREIIKTLVLAIVENVTDQKMERIINTMIPLASAVEGKTVPELSEAYIRMVALPVRVADELMSRTSIEEAIDYIMQSEDIKTLKKHYGIKFGFIRVSAPSRLGTNISEELIKKAQGKGWSPLVIYPNGTIFIASRTTPKIREEHVIDIIRKELGTAFSPKETLKKLVNKLARMPLSKLYDKLEELMSIPEAVDDYANFSDKGKDAKLGIYAYLIAKYLSTGDPYALIRELNEIRNKIKKKTVLDPRALATGLERGGSTYFEDFLGYMELGGDPHNKEKLRQHVENLKEKKRRFLLVAYAVAFATPDTRFVAEVLKTVFGVEVPRSADKEAIRVLALATVYRSLEDVGKLTEAVQYVASKLGKSPMLEYYAKRFVRTRMSSNIFTRTTTDILNEIRQLEETKGNGSYCRICGEPIPVPVLRFKSYARFFSSGGGASEIWLPDDPPLTNLEKLATDRNYSIRYICPLCYYEAYKAGAKQRNVASSYMVLTFHPAVSYDLWEWIKRNARTLVDFVWKAKQRNLYELTRMYADALATMKVTAPTELPKEKNNNDTIIEIDDLGARIYVPLGNEGDIKAKDVALFLALAPLVPLLFGGGQVTLTTSWYNTINVGIANLPVLVPDTPEFLYSIARKFEAIRIKASREKRQMTTKEYAIYNLSYITMIKALLIYALKVVAWYYYFRKTEIEKGKKKELNDYALEILEHINSIPYVPLGLGAPPPPNLNPREGNSSLPWYGLVSSKSLEVERVMLEVDKTLGKATTNLNGLLYRYAAVLAELTERKLTAKLSKSGVQKPLREAVKIVRGYSRVLGADDAISLAVDKALEILDREFGGIRIGTGRKITRKDGSETEVTYRDQLYDIIKKLLEYVVKAREELPPGKADKLVEVMLDSAYEKYLYLTNRR